VANASAGKLGTLPIITSMAQNHKVGNVLTVLQSVSSTHHD
jgi:hypothetical protein